jgi:hypothetical protein
MLDSQDAAVSFPFDAQLVSASRLVSARRTGQARVDADDDRVEAQAWLAAGHATTARIIIDDE